MNTASASLSQSVFMGSGFWLRQPGMTTAGYRSGLNAVSGVRSTTNPVITAAPIR
jgi:hypothetical protein